MATLLGSLPASLLLEVRPILCPLYQHAGSPELPPVAFSSPAPHCCPQASSVITAGLRRQVPLPPARCVTTPPPFLRISWTSSATCSGGPTRRPARTAMTRTTAPLSTTSGRRWSSAVGPCAEPPTRSGHGSERSPQVIARSSPGHREVTPRPLWAKRVQSWALLGKRFVLSCQVGAILQLTGRVESPESSVSQVRSGEPACGAIDCHCCVLMFYMAVCDGSCSQSREL